jgi:hypothetical protein
MPVAAAESTQQTQHDAGARDAGVSAGCRRCWPSSGGRGPWPDVKLSRRRTGHADPVTPADPPVAAARPAGSDGGPGARFAERVRQGLATAEAAGRTVYVRTAHASGLVVECTVRDARLDRRGRVTLLQRLTGDLIRVRCSEIWFLADSAGSCLSRPSAEPSPYRARARIGPTLTGLSNMLGDPDLSGDVRSELEAITAQLAQLSVRVLTAPVAETIPPAR